MKKKIIAACLIFLVSFCVYLKTLCPSVYTGDSGEFITTSYTLGIAHPPGYPLYSLLGRVFTLLPAGSIAARVNIMSAFFASLTALAVYGIVLLLSSSVLAAASAALLVSFSPTMWSQAVTAEVYTLNAFFSCLCIYILLVGEKGNYDRRYLYLLAFIYGLSLTNHFIMLMLAPGFFYFILSGAEHAKIKKSSLLSSLLFFLAGLVFYVYMIIRSSAGPPIDWGNTALLSNFIRHITRIQYRAMEFGTLASMRTKILFVGDFFERVISQVTVFAIWLAPFGLRYLFREKKRFLVMSILIFLFNGLGLIFLLNFPFDAQSRFVVEVYYIPAHCMVAVWIGCGVMYMLEKTKKAGFVLLLLPVIPLLANYPENDMSDYHICYDYGMNILNTLDKNAIFFCSGDDQMFILAYLKFAEKKREDVKVYTDTGFVFENIYGTDSVYLPTRDVRNRIQTEIVRTSPRPIYYALGSNVSNLAGIRSSPAGIMYKIVRPGEKIDTDGIWQKYEMRGIGDRNICREYLTRAIAAQYFYFMGELYFERGDVEKAVSQFEQAIETAHDIDWVQNNITIFYGEKGLFEEIIRQSERVLRLDPENSDACVNMGDAYLRKGMYDKAVESLEKALLLKNNSASARRKLANVCLYKGMLDEALEQYGKSLKIDPRSPEAYTGIGGIYFNKGMLDEAIDFYRKAIEVDSLYVEAHNNLGVVYEKKGMDNEAVQEYEIASRIRPGYPDPHYNMGVVYWKMENWGMVVREFEEALRIDPAYEKAKRFLPAARERMGRK